MKGSEGRAAYSNICKQFINFHPLFALLNLPSADGNYISALKDATEEDLSTALSIMEVYPEGNSSRITACRKRLNELMY